MVLNFEELTRTVNKTYIYVLRFFGDVLSNSQCLLVVNKNVYQFINLLQASAKRNSQVSLYRVT